MWSAIPRWMKNQLESLVGFASEIGHIVRVFCLCIGAYNIALETNSEYIVFYLSYWPTENHEISTDLYSVLFTANLIGWYCFFSDLLSIWNKLQPDKKKWKSQKRVLQICREHKKKWKFASNFTYANSSEDIIYNLAWISL